MVREYSALRYVVVLGAGGTTQLPIGGWYSLFSMGRVKSGWLSKFWCVPVLFRVIPEWSGHHWMPLTGCPKARTLSY